VVAGDIAFEQVAVACVGDGVTTGGVQNVFDEARSGGVDVPTRWRDKMTVGGSTSD